MIIDNFDTRWTQCSGLPFKRDPPLIVNANTELALAIATESLEAISGQSRKVLY